MPFSSLRAFVEALAQAGELHAVQAAVNRRLEISEVTDRVVKAHGPALLFERVEDSAFRVLTNQFGTHRRMAMAFGAQDLDEVGARVRSLIEISPPGSSFGEKIGALARMMPLANAIPRIVRTGAAQDVVVDEPDLERLPILTTWPLDAGPFITLPLVITKHPQTGRYNVGMYRMQVHSG